VCVCASDPGVVGRVFFIFAQICVCASPASSRLSSALRLAYRTDHARWPCECRWRRSKHRSARSTSRLATTAFKTPAGRGPRCRANGALPGQCEWDGRAWLDARPVGTRTGVTGHGPLTLSTRTPTRSELEAPLASRDWQVPAQVRPRRASHSGSGPWPTRGGTAAGRGLAPSLGTTVTKLTPECGGAGSRILMPGAPLAHGTVAAGVVPSPGRVRRVTETAAAGGAGRSHEPQRHRQATCNLKQQASCQGSPG
jgi:hypothetical protein